MVNNYSLNISPYVVPPSVMYRPTNITEQNAPAQNTQNSQNPEDSFQQNKNNRQQNQGFQSAIDYSSSKINIAQVLGDFKNTIAAISTPPEIEEEISGYLNLIELQAKKDLPSSEIIKSNLRSASKILDEYISNTLQKPSKVVEEWINALLLQQVDYKLDPSKAQTSAAEQIINGEVQKPQEEAKVIEKKEENINFFAQPLTEEKVETEIKSKEVFIPEDKTVRKLYAQAISYTQQKDYSKAIKTYKTAFEQAQMLGERETQAYIYNNVGDIFNKTNNLSKALTCYYESANTTEDLSLKSKAHQKMGKIYNDLNKFTPSMQHYFESLSLKGETEDLKNQSKILEEIGEMHSHRYVTKDAVSYFKLGVDIAKETKDFKRISSIFSKTAHMYNNIGQEEKAEKYQEQAQKAKKYALKN